jgi:Xaa-Pro aminopeptidase
MNRIEKFTALFQSEGCGAFLITDPIHLYYLTGLELSTGTLLLRQNHHALIVDGRYLEICKKKSPVSVLLKKDCNLQDLLKGAEVCGIESETTTIASYLELQKEAGIKIEPKSLLERLRAIKAPSEIEALKKAAELGSLGYDHIRSKLLEGVSEEELAFEVEFFWRKQGAEGVAFAPIIAFGKNSSMPHYRAGSTRLKPGDIVLIDIGVKLNHYHSDMTRTLFFGEANPELEKVYAIVKEAQSMALALLKPGVAASEADDAARSFIASKGYGKNFCHSLGHGVGLDIHEFPTIRKTSENPLEAGMVLTIEPGIYIPGIGGVRIEDTVLITNNGYEKLTKCPYA